MLGIRFNSVTKFVEQVGKRQTWKWAELDQMVCVYIGPSSNALQFKPGVNSAHPQYPMMFVTDASILYREAGIAEVNVVYQGVIQSSGGSYIGPPIVTTSPWQGNQDFETLWTQPLTPPVYTYIAGPGGVPTPQGILTSPATFLVGTRTLHVKYWGQQASVRYQAYPEPGGPVYSGLGKSHVRFTIYNEFYGPVNVIASGIGQQYLGQAIAQTGLAGLAYPAMDKMFFGFTKEQHGKFYTVTENYGPIFLNLQ